MPQEGRAIDEGNFNMKRMLNLLLGLLVIGLIDSSAMASKPNVVFIFVDDQGYYDLGCYGATEVRTPRIDALAARGIRFTDYYAAAPICSPSRAGLVTGVYPRRTGNEVWVHRPDATEGIPPERITMAEMFKSEGYATACIGKWHLGFEDRFLPPNQGFDHYFGILHNLDTYEVLNFEDVGGVPLLRNGEIVERNPDPGTLAKRYTDEAISWIETQTTAGPGGADRQPFFLYLPHTMLHNPLGVSEGFAGKSDWGLYGDAIQEMDYHVGRIVDALERLGIDGNTLVVYASDNGRQGGRNPDQPIRGTKLTTYEGGLRVPCIVYGPGLGVQEGLETNAVTHAMDWYPTLASMAGIKVAAGAVYDGRDLSALLTGRTTTIPGFDEGVSLNSTLPLRRGFNLGREWLGVFTQEEYLNAFFYHGSHGALAAVRSGKWKMTLNPTLTLYDLEKDPGELRPINDAKTKRKLRGLVIQFQRELAR